MAARPNIRFLSAFLGAVLTVTLGVTLVVSIYFTLLDLQWIAFLAGVTFAAVVATTTQASRANWRLGRRSQQLKRTRELLGQESSRSHNAAEAMRMLESRMRLVSDAIPSLVLFVDRDEHCRFHNLAVERKTRLPGEKITGRLLRDVVGDAAYADIAPFIPDSLAGKDAEYEFVWESPGSEDLAYSVRHVPYPPDTAQPIGFYVLATAVIRAPAPATTAATRSHATAEDRSGAAHDGDALFAKFISDELTTWEDPRAGLVRALKDDQFLLFAQKILPLKSEFPDPVCFEVLLRLREEEENLLPPGSFIPIAEGCGMMEPLDRWVVRKLIAWCMGKRKQDPAWWTPLFCVNLSQSSVSSQAFAHFVLEELQRTGFPARSLCFEIAEQDAINHTSEVRRLIAALKPGGCRFAIDTFGGVKVSFSYLRTLPVDFIKIDGAAVQNMLRDAAALAKVRGINTVCQKLGIRTVAKFVETRETLDKLRSIGVDYVQGFDIAHPGPIDQVS